MEFSRYQTELLQGIVVPLENCSNLILDIHHKHKDVL